VDQWCRRCRLEHHDHDRNLTRRMFATSGFRERERFAGSFMLLPVMPRQPPRCSCRARTRSARSPRSRRSRRARPTAASPPPAPCRSRPDRSARLELETSRRGEAARILKHSGTMKPTAAHPATRPRFLNLAAALVVLDVAVLAEAHRVPEANRSLPHTQRARVLRQVLHDLAGDAPPAMP
jgi:hypothetical protein